ncbi:MAG TPA: hypothetical protein VKR60_01520 [Candidatus Sulfotelmatobacter sp.]|nr:hypothetical protein [Candidatus Sulfotelmatobacter sp.]
MARIDPEQERRRLIDFYTGQMDGELEKVAGQAYELTDLAREALQAELVRRGLTAELVETAPVVGDKELPGDPPPPEPPPAESAAADGELELRELVTIRKFRDLPEALLAKGSLESAGVEALLVDDNMVRLDWFWSNLMGGIKLQVNPEDAKEASEILNQPIPEGFDVAGVGEYQQPRCPRCQSLDVNFQELDQPVAYVTAYFNVPIPWKRRAWRCHACHTEWEDVEGQDTGMDQSD